MRVHWQSRPGVGTLPPGLGWSGGRRGRGIGRSLFARENGGGAKGLAVGVVRVPEALPEQDLPCVRCPTG